VGFWYEYRDYIYCKKRVYDPLYKELEKMISRFAKVKDIEIFTKDVTKAHTISQDAAQKAYSKVLEGYIGKDFCITLHPDGKLIDVLNLVSYLMIECQLNFL